MKEQTNDQIVIQMLQAKYSMEKTHGFVSKSMRKARETNPVAKLKILQLHHEIQNLKETQGEARKSAAQGLAHALLAPHKSLPGTHTCAKCGTDLNPGAAFCPNCGAQLKAMP